METTQQSESRFYEVSLNMTNKELVAKMNEAGPGVIFFHHCNDDDFSPDPNSNDFLGIRCRDYPHHLVLMSGWGPGVYARAEKLFRRLSDDEVKAYTANWPEYSVKLENEEAEERIESKEKRPPEFGQWIINLWRLLLRILTSLIVFNVGFIAGFWLLVFFDKAKPREALAYSLVFGLLALGLVVVDFIIFRLYRDAKERFSVPNSLSN